MNTDNNKGETDVLVLLNYFKNGFIGIGKAIKNFFNLILKFLVSFLLLVKKNIIYFMISILSFVALWYYMDQSENWKNYAYEIIVEPQFNSTDALYAQIESLNSEVNNPKTDKNILLSVEIEPVKTYKAEVDAYYNTINNELDEDNFYKISNSRDTIFYRQIEIPDFIEKITPKSYKRHIIKIKSKKPLKETQIFEWVTEPIEKNKNFITVKNSYLKALEFSNKKKINTLNKIDTLLLKLSTQEVKNSTSLSLDGGNTKNNVEQDLLDSYNNITESISLNLMKIANSNNVVKIISSPKSVEPTRRIPRNPFAYAGVGFIFMLLLILTIRLYKYLDNIEKKSA